MGAFRIPGGVHMDRISTRCIQCGALDDHPKVHVASFDDADVTYHHDCLPYALREQVCLDPVARQVVEAAESGIRGAALVALIPTLQEG